MKLYLTKAAVAGATNRITIIMQYPISFLLRSSWFFLAMKNMTLPNNTAINGISKYDITNFLVTLPYICIINRFYSLVSGPNKSLNLKRQRS